MSLFQFGVRMIAAGMLCLLFSAHSASASIIVLDQFSETTAIWPVTDSTPLGGPNTVTAESGLASVVGGTRMTNLQLRSANILGVDAAQLAIFPQQGVLDYRSSAGAVADLGIDYAGNTTFGTQGSLNLDLRGYSGIGIEIANLDLGASPVEVYITGWTNGVQMFGNNTSITTAGAQSFLVPFSVPDSQLQDIHRINLTFFAMSGGTDLQITQIAVVPEPATLGLAGLAAAITLLARRRRS
jgi:hypothetical protein